MFRVREIIDELKGEYDFVVIDTPPNEGYMTYNALAAADEVIVPVASRGFSEEGLAQTIEGIEHARRVYNKNLPLGQIVFTNVENGPTVSSSWVAPRFSAREIAVNPCCRLHNQLLVQDLLRSPIAKPR